MPQQSKRAEVHNKDDEGVIQIVVVDKKEDIIRGPTLIALSYC